MPSFISDSPLAEDLIRIGDEAIARKDDAALRAYFREDYIFHGAGGDLSFDQLSAYFASLRAAFSDLRIVREQIIVDGNFLAARVLRSPVTSTGVFTYSPVGPVEPTGQHLGVGSDRYLQVRRRGLLLAEEWVQTDYRSFLTKLGVTTAESAQQGWRRRSSASAAMARYREPVVACSQPCRSAMAWARVCSQSCWYRSRWAR